MTIAKAVEIFLKYVDKNSEREIKTEADFNEIENDLKKYLKSEKTYYEVSYKIELAEKKGYLVFNENADTFGEAVDPTSSFTEYIIEREKTLSKFLSGLIGSALTIFGGLVGALITALV